MRTVKLGWRSATLAGLGLVLGGCATSTALVPPCCYEGPFAMARLSEVSVVTEDGRRLRAEEALAGLHVGDGVLNRSLPLRKVDIPQVVQQQLQRVFPLYDANANGVLEEPELTALYVVEAARGVGVAGDRLEVGGKPAPALVLASADIGGLVSWVEARRAQMTPQGRALFEELEMLGRDLRVRGVDNADRERRVFPEP
ncbi:MAG: hypothetical protein H6983_06215 [Ectothiorhodospiraceae bacterium]|nr:hypothetical protein [Ectothiorhodospiraceae bacterium]